MKAFMYEQDLLMIYFLYYRLIKLTQVSLSAEQTSSLTLISVAPIWLNQRKCLYFLMRLRILKWSSQSRNFPFLKKFQVAFQVTPDSAAKGAVSTNHGLIFTNNISTKLPSFLPLCESSASISLKIAGGGGCRSISFSPIQSVYLGLFVPLLRAWEGGQGWKCGRSFSSVVLGWQRALRVCWGWSFSRAVDSIAFESGTMNSY